MKKTIVKFTKFQKEDGTWDINQDIYERDLTEKEIQEKIEEEIKRKEEIETDTKFEYQICFSQDQINLPKNEILEKINKMIDFIKEDLIVRIEFLKENK